MRTSDKASHQFSPKESERDESEKAPPQQEAADTIGDLRRARARFIIAWVFIIGLMIYILPNVLETKPAESKTALVKSGPTIRQLVIDGQRIDYAGMERDKALFVEANECWSYQRYDRMMEILWDLNSKGYRKAITLLGNAYLTGNGVERSYDLGRLHWKRGAMLGNVYAMQGLSDSFASSLQGYEPVESAMWSIVANAFENPSSAFATGSTETAKRLAKLSASERELAMMNAKSLIERIRENKRRYEEVIDESL